MWGCVEGCQCGYADAICSLDLLLLYVPNPVEFLGR